MASMGALSKLGISASNPVDAQFEFLSENIRKTGNIVDTGGIRGTRSHPSERTRAGNYTIGGTLSMEPGPEELALLLPWVLGAAASGTTFALAETVPSRYITIDRIAKVMTYAGCYVNRATFRASEGTPLRLDIDVVGQTETVGDAATFPSLSLQTSAPFIFTDGVFSLQSGNRSVKELTVVIDNALAVAFNNSASASTIDASDRSVTTTLSTPYTSSETALYGQALAGAAATYTFTNGAYSLLFTFATLQFPDRSPVVQNKGEVVLQLEGTARTLSTTKELVITLDSTP